MAASMICRKSKDKSSGKTAVKLLQTSVLEYLKNNKWGMQSTELSRYDIQISTWVHEQIHRLNNSYISHCVGHGRLPQSICMQGECCRQNAWLLDYTGQLKQKKPKQSTVKVPSITWKTTWNAFEQNMSISWARETKQPGKTRLLNYISIPNIMVLYMSLFSHITTLLNFT